MLHDLEKLKEVKPELQSKIAELKERLKFDINEASPSTKRTAHDWANEIKEPAIKKAVITMSTQAGAKTYAEIHSGS